MKQQRIESGRKPKSAIAEEIIRDLQLREGNSRMVLWDVPLWIALITLFVFGATIGAFPNVCIYRMPNACREPMSIPQEIAAAWKSLPHPPSRCGYCFHPIALRDNIPILGWFILRGRCRHCRRSYSVRYAGIELLNG